MSDSPNLEPTITTTAGGCYKSALQAYVEAQLAGNVPLALQYIRQAEFIGIVILKREKLIEVNAGYTNLLVSACRSARNLALKCGNITSDHQTMAHDIQSIACQLKFQFLDRVELQARASVIEGLAATNTQHVDNLLDHEQLSVTPANDLDRMVDGLTAMITQAIQLDTKIDEPFGSGQDLLDLAHTSLSNSRDQLNWFFSQKLSDWDKALVFCRRARQLLSHHLTVEESESAAGTTLELNQLAELLKQTENALTQRSYRKSKPLLTEALGKIESLVEQKFGV